jgi:hypothetical protein
VWSNIKNFKRLILADCVVIKRPYTVG